MVGITRSKVIFVVLVLGGRLRRLALDVLRPFAGVVPDQTVPGAVGLCK